MSQLLIKICGVKTPQTLAHVIAEGADIVGFVSFEKSPRHLELTSITNLVAQADNRIKTAILLVNPTDSEVADAVATGVTYIQLHGHEQVSRVAQIKSASGLKIIKALPIGDASDIDAVAPYADYADLLILDAKPPQNADRPGGLGKSFDWSLLKRLDPSLKYMLSGGLNVDNVAQAVREVQPFGLDTSSGVELIKGVKDNNLITQFISQARLAHNNL